MMDVSDGLIRDVRRMAKASNVWIDIRSSYLEQHVEVLIPVRRAGWDSPRSMGVGDESGFDRGRRPRIPRHP